jgi:hypothetical protein
VAGVINYAKKLKGVQVGLINIADSSDGYSIGLINIILKGYHKLSFSTNEVLNLNAGFKTGNSKLYSILVAGINLENNKKAYSFGYGLGSEIILNKKRSLSLNPELSSQYLYLGSWNYTNILNRAQLNLHIHISKFLSVFAGPAYTAFISDQTSGIAGYKFPVPGNLDHTHEFSNKVKGWIGWNIGVHIF